MEKNQQPQSLREVLAQLDAQGITDYRRYDAVRRFLNFKAREKNVSISGTFELTPLCNLDCKMCYVHLHKEQMHGAELIPTDAWKSIMRQAVDAGMMYARVTGGECLTYPGFRELYLYLADMGVETAVLSNGILIDADMAAFFKAHPPAGIQVTLYGASEDAYEQVTGHRMFGRVMENLHRLQDMQIPLSIAVTPNAFMSDGLEVVRLLHKEGFHFSINSGIIAPREETGRKTADADVETYVSMLKLQRALSGREIEPECDPDSLPDPSSAGTAAAKGVRCGAGRSSFSVDWQGQMRPCNTFPCEPADVQQLGFAESWRRINKIALNFQRPTECEGCYYHDVCKHCVAEHAVSAPVGHASPNVCQWGKRMVAEGLLKVPT
ncbi:MAG: radical SAM protein [Clostridia bacterium]|nr:radical SAM protein [Clostridia bacterium]